MTERSYVWDGLVTGDATLAPYGKEEFNKFAHLSLISSSLLNCVVPAYLHDLKVEPAGSYLLAVKVGSGASVFNNYVYELDTDTTLPIERPSTGYRRMDLVILRLYLDQSDAKYQTVRLTILKGTEQLVGTPLVAPVLTQNAFVWEVALARVFVDNPATYTYIVEGNVHDLRQFAITDKSKALYDGSFNLVKNSEFMAYTGGGSATLYPEGWYAGGFTALASIARIEPQVRGQAMAVNTGTLAQIIPVSRNTKTFTLRCLVSRTNVNTVLTIQLAGVKSDGSFTVKFLRRTLQFEYSSGPDIYDHKETFTFEDDDIDYLVLSFPCTNTATISQAIVVPGYHPGPYREFHETIPFRTAVTDGSWSNTAKSSGTTTISLTASFGGIVLSKTRAIMLRVRGNDSGSGAGTPSLSIQGYVAPFNTVYGSLLLAGVTNDVKREMQVIVPVWNPLWYASATAPQFRAVVLASGAATFDATLEVVGIIT